MGIPFDGKTVFDSDQLLWGDVSTVPRDIIVIGAGVIGVEYASMFNIIPGLTVSQIDCNYSYMKGSAIIYSTLSPVSRNNGNNCRPPFDSSVVCGS